MFPGYIAAIHDHGASYDVQYDDGDFRPNVAVRGAAVHPCVSCLPTAMISSCDVVQRCVVIGVSRVSFVCLFLCARWRWCVQMSDIVLDDPDYKAYIEQVIMRQRDFQVGKRVMVRRIIPTPPVDPGCCTHQVAGA